MIELKGWQLILRGNRLQLIATDFEDAAVCKAS